MEPLPRLHALVFGAKRVERTNWNVQHDRLLSAVGSVEAQARTEADVDRAHDQRVLAWDMWQERAGAAGSMRAADGELKALQEHHPQQEKAASGLTLTEANRQPVFEHCHFVEDSAFEDVATVSKKARLAPDRQPPNDADRVPPPITDRREGPVATNERRNLQSTPHGGFEASRTFGGTHDPASSVPAARPGPQQDVEANNKANSNGFKSATVYHRQEMAKKGAGQSQQQQQQQQTGNRMHQRGGHLQGNNSGLQNSASLQASGGARTTGLKRRPLHPRAGGGQQGPQKQPDQEESNIPEELIDHPELKNVEPKMIELVLNEVLDRNPGVTWDDIAGLHYAKKIMNEVVVLPMLRPDIFTGLRAPPKGVLLFGPPGTGKTMIGKAIASETDATFFSVSASSLMSKWIGEGEKMVRALFSVARCYQPAVVFVDEIDSLLTCRTDGEQEATRRVKTEFLVQIDGAGVSKDTRVLLVGATNLPHQLDEAARRRMAKRILIPLPDEEGRQKLICNAMATTPSNLTEDEISAIVVKSDGYSGSDLQNLCSEAAMGPVRGIQHRIKDMKMDEMRPIEMQDFEAAFFQVRASVSKADLVKLEDFDRNFGSGSGPS